MVRRQVINAADAAADSVADLECLTTAEVLVMAVEVTDKELSWNKVQAKLKNARVKQVSDVIFLAQRGMVDGDKGPLRSRVEAEFQRGQNVYITTIEDLTRAFLLHTATLTMTSTADHPYGINEAVRLDLSRRIS